MLNNPIINPNTMSGHNINKEADSKHLLLNFWFMILEHMPHYNMLKLIHFTLHSVYVKIFGTIMDEGKLYQSMVVEKHFLCTSKMIIIYVQLNTVANTK
jgi:hypothetical protein